MYGTSMGGTHNPSFSDVTHRSSSLHTSSGNKEKESELEVRIIENEKVLKLMTAEVGVGNYLLGTALGTVAAGFFPFAFVAG